jgi:hypothetical protein
VRHACQTQQQQQQEQQSLAPPPVTVVPLVSFTHRAVCAGVVVCVFPLLFSPVPDDFLCTQKDFSPQIPFGGQPVCWLRDT